MNKSVLFLFVLLLPLARTTAQTPETDRAASLSAQVVKLYKENRNAEALPLAKEALALREKVLGPNHLLVAEAAHNLASLHFRLYQYQEAATLAQRAFAIMEKLKPLPEEPLAGTLLLLGGIDYARANYEPAALYFQRALTLREKLSGPENAETLDLVITLANAYRNATQFDSAEFLYRSYVETQTRRGGNPADIGYALERISCLLWWKGEDKEAENLEQRSDQLRGFTGPVLEVKPSDLRRKEYSQPAPAIVIDKKHLVEFRYFLDGEVYVRLLLNEKGETLRACAVAGPPVLFPFYENAARRTRFSPFTDKNNQPAKASGVLRYIFEFGQIRPRKGN